MNKKLSVGRMLVVASGEFFGGGSFNIINFLYPGFLVLAVGLPPHLAGVVMLIARFFDAFIDPPIGLVSDRIRARFGTRRISLAIAAPLILLSLFLMFFPYSDPNEAVRFAAVLLSYIFFATVQSSVMIPYYSLASEITDDYTERARMTTLRMCFSITASIVCVAVPGLIVDAFDGNTGYMAMSLIFGAIFMICVGITGLFSKEGIPAPPKEEKYSLKDFIRPFWVRPFRQYLTLFLCCQVTMAVMSTLFFFYVDFYFCRDMTARGEANIVGLVGAALMFGMQIVALPIYLHITKKTNKTTAYIIGSVIWIAGALVLFIMPANANPVLIYLLAAVIGFGISGPGLIPHAILPDVIDVGNLQFGARTAGAFSGVANLVIQLGQAIGVSVVMTLIGMAGFVEQDISEGAAKVVSQSESAQQAIIAIMALAPLIFMVIGIVACLRFRLNKERHEAVLAALNGSESEKEAVLATL
ncbi:MAG: MFS transporter [Lachnospiraceae bacterium]|nr:MFS transporter [Lachnospiraceae bacterium]